ncbi:hypothetical protein BVRB_7g170810 [Beta vulgaris subsp. vulgaris]|nr:hypothetical protein BVRB_7g170810 [Beta vulgaris subsp. vulgaris]
MIQNYCLSTVFNNSIKSVTENHHIGPAGAMLNLQQHTVPSKRY